MRERPGLVLAVVDPRDTRLARPDVPPPRSKAWTHRFKEAGKPADYELFDRSGSALRWLPNRRTR